ncbi:hypothetical protein [Serratia fonticola]|uniref:hypothetical protein n=1 Tax=Serratia fonticola TaxID=47917 RepID=UPI003AAEB9C3
MPTYREYKQQRPLRGLYDSLTVSHESFGDQRIVSGQFFPKTLGGAVYEPSNFEIEESQQSGTPIVDATIKLGRLASNIKTILKSWTGFSRIKPITVTRRVFDSADPSAPIKQWTLFAKSIDLDADAASMVASLTNPLNNNIGRLYDPQEYTGLAHL